MEQGDFPERLPYINLNPANWPHYNTSPPLKIAIDTALETRKLLRAGFNSSYSSFIKPDQSDYTPYDIQAEIIARRQIRQYYPYVPIMGEELTPNEHMLDGNFWVIDPIDGTTNFARGIHFANFTIAMIKEGETQVGVVCDFLHDNIYYAFKGHGAYKNGIQMQVATRSFNESVISFAPLLNVRSQKGYFEEEQVKALWDGMRKIAEKSGRFPRELQSGALELAMVANGQLDGYVSSWTNPWDLSAGVLLVKEAGGIVTNILGAEWQPSFWGVLAGSCTIHPEIFQIINRNFLLNLPELTYL